MSDAEYDALLVVSFGGPEGPADVLPFLENVTRGRGVPRERLLEVAGHYERFGGVSPIGAQTRALVAAVAAELEQHGPPLPVYLGNRNWHPYLADTLRQMRDDGVGRALALFTSAYNSYSSCRQYRENIAAAQAEVGEGAPRVDKLRAYFNHPGFVDANAQRLKDALDQLEALPGDEVHVVFTAHSIPLPMAYASAYEAQLEETARLVAAAAAVTDYALVYQSRSGSPAVPWLGPDVEAHLAAVAQAGRRRVALAPIGFVSDHMEVVFDLDTEALPLAGRLGLAAVRAGTAGTHPKFVAMIRELVLERLEPWRPKPALGRLGPAHDECAVDCCL